MVLLNGCDTTKPNRVIGKVDAEITMATVKDYVEIFLVAIGEVTIDWGDGNRTADIFDIEDFDPNDHEQYKYIRAYNHFYQIPCSNVISIYGVVTYLVVEGQGLTELDVTKNKELRILGCGYNQLADLELRNNALLQELHCVDNKIINLNLSKNPLLRQFIGTANQFIILDFKNNPLLEKIECIANELIYIDISKNTRLRSLMCGYNQLTELDLSKNVMLDFLECSENQLTNLDLKNNVLLEFLICSDNQLKKLDVSKLDLLHSLTCKSNMLSVTALNDLFVSLNSSTGYKNLYIGNNPGTGGVDKSIAEAKGWRVYE